jgi:hypothetical protein
MHTFTVFKRTGTHADVLAAVGAADLLRQCDPVIVSRPDRFEIRLQRPAVPQMLSGADQTATLDDFGPGATFDALNSFTTSVGG